MAAIRYLVDRVDLAVEFYTKHLGFALKEDWGPVVVLTRDDLDLWVSGPASSAGKTAVDGRAAVPGGANRFVVPVENLAAQVEALKAAGVRLGTGIVKGPAGAWVVVLDPAGNAIEIFEAVTAG